MADSLHLELMATRARLDKIRRLHKEKAELVEVDRALLEQESTFPRKRREVEAELHTAEVFDCPMLAEEIEIAEKAIAEIEKKLREGERALKVSSAHSAPANPAAGL